MHHIRKSERLNNYRLKKSLFEKGKSFRNHPFKIFWHTMSEDFNKTKHPTLYTADIVVGKNSTEKIRNNYDLKKQNSEKSDFFIYPGKVIISVPAKKINNATDRNYIKRLIKEAYRKNKNLIYSFLKQKSKNCLIALVYIGDKLPTQNEVDEKIFVSLKYLIREIEKHVNKSKQTK